MIAFALELLASIGELVTGAAKRWGATAIAGGAAAAILVAFVAGWYVFGGPSRVELAAMKRRAQDEALASVERASKDQANLALERAREAERKAAAERERGEAAAKSADEAWQKVQELLRPNASTVCFSPEAVEAMRKW